MNIATVTVLLTLLSCSVAKNQKAYIGNWQGCIKDGTYLEIYISDSTLKFCFEDIGVSFNTNLYRVNKDTLVYMNEDGKGAVKLTYSFPNQKTMVWNCYDPNETWEFHRFSEKVMEYPIKTFDSTTLAIYESIKKDIKLRASKYKCLDKRTEEEKHRDSVEKQNVFKF